MNITLPSYQQSYESLITEQAYNKVLQKAQVRLNQALQLYERYCESQDSQLYEVFDGVLGLARNNLLILALTVSEAMSRIAENLWEAGEALSYIDDSYRATMIMDLAGAIRN